MGRRKSGGGKWCRQVPQLAFGAGQLREMVAVRQRLHGSIFAFIEAFARRLHIVLTYEQEPEALDSRLRGAIHRSCKYIPGILRASSNFEFINNARNAISESCAKAWDRGGDEEMHRLSVTLADDIASLTRHGREYNRAVSTFVEQDMERTKALVSLLGDMVQQARSILTEPTKHIDRNKDIALYEDTFIPSLSRAQNGIRHIIDRGIHPEGVDAKTRDALGNPEFNDPQYDFARRDRK